MIKDKQFVVIGLGRFGTSVAITLADAGYEVMAVDEDEDKVQDISSFVTHAVQADATDADVLSSLGVSNFDTAVVSIGRDIQSSIMVTLLLKEMGIGYVVAKATNRLHEKVLNKLGADRVILPEQDMGVRIATNLMSGNIMDYIQLSSDYSIVEIAAAKEWANKTIKEINMRAKYGVNIIAVERNKQIKITPGADFVLYQDDILVVVGNNDQIREIETEKTI